MLNRIGNFPAGKEFTNSIGMKFACIKPGVFQMGQVKTPLPKELLPIIDGKRGGLMDFLNEGDYDEHPVHTVEISTPFYMGTVQITNAQYELFAPDHKMLRGKDGFSTEDDEAVVCISWYEAQAFCQWLSDKDGLPYRLPTEAEWEYACRAGTETNYHTGDILPEIYHKNAERGGTPNPVPLHVGKTPPNAWGLYDMHGNVEEWCQDWYGPYESGTQKDPIGRADGDFKVTRGGSHGTYTYFLRSANRMGTLPENKHWMIGFRVVLGELPASKPLPVPSPPLNRQNVVKRDAKEVAKEHDPDKPYFRGPRKYVKIPREVNGPLYAGHNHDPAIAQCPNGDLLAIWYTCVSEKDRELALAASRLRYGEEEWEPASPFFKVPDRNGHAPALWFDGEETLYSFLGVSVGAAYKCMALAMLTSKDSGATWSKSRIVSPEHGPAHQPSGPVFRAQDGSIIVACDYRGSTLWISHDEGLSWTNPGGIIKGIHTGVVQLDDGRLLAYGRGGDIDGKMPMSVSSDMGKTFTYAPSEFPPIGGGQRLVLLKLREGPLFFSSYANEPITITDSTGEQHEVEGLFAAVSLDNGKTWPYKRLITDDKPGHPVEGTDGGLIMMSGRNAEYRGYSAGCQGTNGLIHLITSRQHYTFNLKWLMTPPPPPAPPVRVKHEVETFAGPNFDLEDWADYKGYRGGFNGRGQYTVDSRSHFNGLNRMVGEGSFEVNIAFQNIRFNPGGPNTGLGITVGFKDKRSKSMLMQIKADRLELSGGEEDIRLSTPPKSAKVKFIWKESARQWEVFYGIDGDDANTEFPQSKDGIYYERPWSDSTTAFIQMSNGSMDVDYYEVKPI